MKKISLVAIGYEIVTKRMCKREILDEMNQTQKSNQWHFGMKADIGVDADSGLVHTDIGTAANIIDVAPGHGTNNFELYVTSASDLIYLIDGMGKPIGVNQ